MKLPRRKFLHLTASAAALPAISRVATAQTYPSHPITMVVPLAAGGPLDVVGRLLAGPMGAFLGQQIMVENVSGRNGSIGAARAAGARPDGYTLSLGTNSTHSLNGALYSLPYNLLSDFTPISPLVTLSLVLLARKALPAKNLSELIAWLKANPSKASAGVDGAIQHLLFALFQKETGTQITLVPYGGGAPAVQDLVGGQIDLFLGAPNWLSQSGRVNAYAVASETRLALAPDIPTFREMGFAALAYSGWFGLFAPNGTPAEIIGRLNAATVQALADPAVRSRLVDLGFEVFSRDRQNPEALGAMQNADAKNWWPLIKEFGIKAE